jgi:GPH family glycoside/pentoside/hexuronide:cation symporter
MGAFYKLNEQLFMQIVNDINMRKGNHGKEITFQPVVNTQAIKEV